MTEPKEGDLRIWWIPQVPMEAFSISVNSIAEGMKITDTLAKYDLFQLAHNIKPDYSNAGGVARYENGEWCDIDIDDPEYA